MIVKDTHLRGLLLEVFYKRRRESWFVPTAAELGVNVSDQDILQVCAQLAEHRMLDWKPLKVYGNANLGTGKISAFGIDVIENGVAPDIKVEFVHNQTTVNITGSTNVVVGDNNSQTVTQSVRDLVAIIESATAPDELKAEAKSLLRKFLEHPLLAALAGGAVGLLG